MVKKKKKKKIYDKFSLENFTQHTSNKADILKTIDVFAHCECTQLSVFWAAEGVQVSFAVHHHAKFCTTSHLHQGLAIV